MTRGTGTNKQVFTTIYQTNHWGSTESVSGPGSDMAAVQELLVALPQIFSEFDITSMLDIPCGDFHWMQKVDMSHLDSYIGADIVSEIVKSNNSLYANEKISFQELDVTQDTLPKVDLVFCRDCLVHLSTEDALKAVKNISASGSKYLMSTTYVDLKENADSQFGKWRPLNLEKAPFNLAQPFKMVATEYTDNGKHYPGNGMGIWRLPI